MPHQTEPSPEERLRAAYETTESRTAKAFEDAVSTASFGALLARSAENVAALARIGSDAADLVLRNLRLAGRADVTRLARQLHRTEDKLERVLQEVEALRDELARREATADRAAPEDAASSGPDDAGSSAPDDSESGAPDDSGRGVPDDSESAAPARGRAASGPRASGGRSANGARTSTPRRRTTK